MIPRGKTLRTSEIIVLICLTLIAFLIRGWWMLRAWARANNYTLLHLRWCILDWGPFFFWKGRSSTVWRIEVQTRSGDRRRGYACLGDYFLGMWMSNDVRILWDGEDPACPQCARNVIGWFFEGVRSLIPKRPEREKPPE